MKNKQLLNERVLGLAGIHPMPSLGFVTNTPSTINEHHGAGVITTNENPDQFYTELKDALDRGVSVESKVPGAMGEVMGIENKTGVVIRSSNGNGVVGFTGEPTVELYEDEHENYYIQLAADSSEHDPIAQKNADERYGSLNEDTRRETLGMTHKITKFKVHEKSLVTERMMGFAGITPLKPIGFVSTNAPSVDTSQFMKYLYEDTDSLSRKDLYSKLPMLHSNVLLELAEKYVENVSGQSWGFIVETLSDVYYTNDNVRDSIHKAIKESGII